MTGSTQEISAAQAAALLGEEGVVFLDVREPWEVEICHIAGALHVPMGQIVERQAEIPRDGPLVVLCHHGMRSRQVMHYLAREGFPDVRNLQGGIDAWAREIDPGLALY